MAEGKSEVMSMVEDEIVKDREVSTSDLFEKAQELDSDMSDLTIRQFNARYPLQVKRRLAPKRTRTRRTRRKSKNGAREEIRSIMLSFAEQVADAESTGDIVRAVSSVDKFVDRVVKSAGKT